MRGSEEVPVHLKGPLGDQVTRLDLADNCLKYVYCASTICVGWLQYELLLVVIDLATFAWLVCQYF